MASNTEGRRESHQNHASDTEEQQESHQNHASDTEEKQENHQNHASDTEEKQESRPKETGHRRSSSYVTNIIQSPEFQNEVVSPDFKPQLKEKFLEIGRFLRGVAKDFGEQSAKINLRLSTLNPKFQKKYEILKTRVDIWRPGRVNLIEKLKSGIDRLDSTSKASTAVRFLASTVDASGTTGALWFPEHPWAGPATKMAAAFGLLGLFCTVYEVDSTKRTLNDLCTAIDEDLKLLKQVLSWFEKETVDIDSDVTSIVPDYIEYDTVRKIQETLAEEDESQEQCLSLLRAALSCAGRRDLSKVGDLDFLNSLLLFCNSDIGAYWWNKIIFRKHPIDLDVSRVSLQMEFGQLQTLVMKSIPALPLEQQRLSSLPVAGKLILNGLTMYDSFSELRKGAKSTYTDKLRMHLHRIEKELEVIDKTVEGMRPKNGNSRPRHFST